MSHTPGPWSYSEGTKTIRSEPTNYWLATMDSWDGAVDHAANAKLIARAPETAAERDRLRTINAELLAELERMEQAALCMADPEHCLHASRDHLPWKALVVKARIAIAKAKGAAS